VKKHAFTLIELLIVVAIIAILAAIAVPNFLEAQVRAKVSRVMSDQRAIATAVEAYTLDNGRPPIDCNYGYVLGLWPIGARDAALNCLTTPVGYMSSIPLDPFVMGAGHRDTSNRLLNERTIRFYCWMDPNRIAYQAECYAKGFVWSLESPGPSRVHSAPWLAEMVATRNLANIYDATNGTVSIGYISRTNKGEFTGAQL